MYFLVSPFLLHCNQNRSALLLKLISDNSLLAVSSVNYFTMIIAIADLCCSVVVHFRNAVEHLHLTDMRFILHPLLISCMRLRLLAIAFKQFLVHLYYLASQLFQSVHFLDLLLHGLLEAYLSLRISPAP